MSRHELTSGDKKTKWVFGWDQHLMSFFLQVHDLTKEEDAEDRIPVWLGATRKTQMYEVEDLVRQARLHGLRISLLTRRKLFAEKDDGE